MTLHFRHDQIQWTSMGPQEISNRNCWFWYETDEILGQTQTLLHQLIWYFVPGIHIILNNCENWVSGSNSLLHQDLSIAVVEIRPKRHCQARWNEIHGYLDDVWVSFETSPLCFYFRGCFNHLCPPKSIVWTRLFFDLAAPAGLQDKIHEILRFSWFVCPDGVDEFSRKDSSKSPSIYSQVMFSSSPPRCLSLVRVVLFLGFFVEHYPKNGWKWL